MCVLTFTLPSATIRQHSHMKTPSQKTETDFSKDLKTFDKLPAHTKELVMLKDDAEKATGQESVALQKMIQAKARQGTPRPTGITE